MGPAQGMGPGQMMMRGQMMRPGMMGAGAAQGRPTLRIETPDGLSFTCNDDLQACLQAFEQVRAAGNGQTD